MKLIPKNKKLDLPGINIKTPNGFEKIYRLYWKKLFGICYYQLQDEELAKEIVQDIFKALWEKRERLEIKSSIEAYLIRAVKLEVMEYYRTKATHHEHLLRITANLPDQENTTAETVAFQELSQSIDELIEQLPSQCKRVFELSRAMGMKNREIATELLISEKAVEYHISKALYYLRANLREYRSA